MEYKLQNYNQVINDNYFLVHEEGCYVAALLAMTELFRSFLLRRHVPFGSAQGDVPSSNGTNGIIIFRCAAP
jgi:hypothetical protein